tara:strand:+ start:1000 stop:1683 length:684 start_codon:yes stop_codon:yes gene_type:complete
MKIKQLFFILIIFSLNLRISAQNEDTSMRKLVSILNEKIAPTVQFTIENDSGFVSILKVKQNISLKRSIKNSPFFKSQNNKKGPYIGPIYWIYNFEKIKATSATFKQDSSGIVQLGVKLYTSDTIVINVKKNAYSSVHKTIDVKPHKVIWMGKQSLLFNLKLRKEMNQIHLKVQDVTIEGMLKRTDQFELARNFSSDLANAFKPTFIKIFENPAFVIQLNEILAIEP